MADYEYRVRLTLRNKMGAFGCGDTIEEARKFAWEAFDHGFGVSEEPSCETVNKVNDDGTERVVEVNRGTALQRPGA